MRSVVLALASVVATSGPAPAEVSPDVQTVYVQGTALLQTRSATLAPVPGLQLTLPGLSLHHHDAMVTFNAPMAGGEDCKLFVYADSAPVATGYLEGFGSYVNSTIVVKVALKNRAQTLQMEWQGTGSAGLCVLDAFYSFSALLTDD